MGEAEAPGSRWRLRSLEQSGECVVQDRGVLDELVLEHWLHLEQLDTNRWWLRVGDADILVEVVEDGAVRVHVERGAHGEVNGETCMYQPPAKTR